MNILNREKQSVLSHYTIQDGLCFAAVLVCAGAALWMLLIRWGFIVPGMCDFYRMTGFYCPGCGGTRAVLALLSGDFAGAFLFHPFVPYLFVTGGWFCGRCALHWCVPGKVSYPQFSQKWIWIGIAVILVQWIVKNILLINGIIYLS
ncbi:MAG: DUF2752 domain-containing protein [Eubacteriaceae bacterium]|jgi:hypothetical protein